MGNKTIYLDNCSYNRPFDDQTKLLREPFDYTEWRKNNLCKEMSIEEISKDAMAKYKQNTF